MGKRTREPSAGLNILRAATLAALVLFASTARAAEMDDQVLFFFQAEEFGYRFGDGEDSFNWEVQGWVGNDEHKLWLKSEGEDPLGGELEHAEAQVLYSRPIADFWDLQVGVRYDIKPDPERVFAVFGLQGLAPYRFEIDAAAFVSDEGQLSARLQAEYKLLLTQKLILEPSAEINLAAGDDKEPGVGSGLNDVEVGLRLRYEIKREFAPYIGVHWERKFGETADLARAEGEDEDRVAFLAGLRFWF